MIAVYIILWIGVGIICAGFTHGFFCRNWPYFRSYPMILILPAVMGPLGIISTLIACDFRTFRLRPIDKEEAWAAHQKTFPHLDREFFDRTW